MDIGVMDWGVGIECVRAHGVGFWMCIGLMRVMCVRARELERRSDRHVHDIVCPMWGFVNGCVRRFRRAYTVAGRTVPRPFVSLHAFIQPYYIHSPLTEVHFGCYVIHGNVSLLT